MKERAEQGGIFRIEDVQSEHLSKRLEMLLKDEPNADELLVDAALAMDDLKAGKEPNMDWVPDHLRVEVLSEWNEAADRLNAFKEDREERMSAELQETAERSAKLSELEEKFGEIPEEGTPIPQRKIATQIVRKPQSKSGFRKFFDRLAGNP